MSKHISLSGLKTLLEPLVHLINKKAERPDWNENDPSSPDYIENRPFYETTSIVEYTVDVFNDFISYDVPLPSFVDGETYSITWDGVKYSCVAYTTEYGFAMIGNDIIAEAGSTGGNGEPFAMVVFEGDNLIFAETTGNHTIGLVGTVVHKIDEKYLPNLIGAKGTGLNAEIFNSYIYNVASGDYSHAEGIETSAYGDISHAEGLHTVADGIGSHAEGSGTRASSLGSHAQGKYNIEGVLAHIVGNGTSDTARSNAHTLDWDGNAWYSGDVYVGSTSGTNKDEGSKKLATEEFVSATLDELRQEILGGEW